MFYEEVLSSLQKHEVRYLILGGAAVNLHGVPRMTGDLDLAVDLSQTNVDRLIEALADIGLHPAVPVDPHGLANAKQRRQWSEEKNLKALTFQRSGNENPYMEVDIVLDVQKDFDKMYDDRVNLDVSGLSISVVSLEHLLQIKRGLGREQDLADVESLEKIASEENDG